MKSDNGRVLILGATGRVGGSAARALVKSCPNVHLVLEGRNRCGPCSSCSRPFPEGRKVYSIGSCDF
jgi:hypothetical protein